MTSIVLKSEVTLLDIVSTRMLGQFGFLSTVFNIFAESEISVDVVATSEVSISLTLDPRWDAARISPVWNNTALAKAGGCASGGHALCCWTTCSL